MQWYPELQENVGNVPKIFVGNKIDLREEFAMYKKDPKEAPIMRETARKIIEEEFQCKYMECSALTQEGLKAIFDEAMRIVIQKKMKPIVKKKQDSSFCNLIWFVCISASFNIAEKSLIKTTTYFLLYTVGSMLSNVIIMFLYIDALNIFLLYEVIYLRERRRERKRERNFKY